RSLTTPPSHSAHVNGNRVSQPPVDIIGHEFTGRKLTGDIMVRGMFADLLRGLPGQREDVRSRRAAEPAPAARTRLDQQLRVQSAFAEQLKELKVTPPNITV